MSNTFYKFIALQIINYFREVTIQPGDKYHVQFEKLEEVSTLIETIKIEANNLDIYNDFIWPNPLGKRYESFILTFGEKEILIAGTDGGVTEDFLIKLRNTVGTTESNFENKAILFVHHTTLDSIVGGSVGLQNNGMPLSFQAVRNHISDTLENSDLNDETKTVLSYVLEKKEVKDLTEANKSFFEFEDILSAINENIKPDDYPSLGLFYDSELSTIHDKVIREKRLNNNHEFFSMIEDAFSYGDPESDLDKHFDEAGVKEILDNDWKTLGYQFIKNSNENVIDVSPPSYIEENIKETNEGLIYWDRPEGETKTKARKRHIIIFNPYNEDQITFELRFDKFLKKEFLKNLVGQAATVSKKRIMFTHTFETGKLNFLRFRYKQDNATFDFKVVIIPLSESYFTGIKTNFEVEPKRKESAIKILTSGKEIVFQEKQDFNTVKIDLEQQSRIAVSKEDTVIVNEADEYIQNQGGEVQILLNLEDLELSLKFVSESPKLQYIDGMTIYKLKREKEQSFTFKDENRVVQGTQESMIKDEQFLENLMLESFFVENGSLALDYDGHHVTFREIQVPENLYQVYKEYVDYFRAKGILPSLAFWDNELLILAKRYIDEFVSCIEDIEDGATLSKHQKEIVYLGSVTRDEEYPVLMYSPLHPINVAYQYSFIKIVGNEEIPREILERLDSKNLNPYVFFNSEIFKPIDQIHSPEWTLYHHYKNARYNLSDSFVSKLVADKLLEFTKHYSYLFELNNRAPIKLNLVNLGDSKEVLQGIFGYYLAQVKKGVKLEELLPIDLMIYGDVEAINAFEELSFYSRYEEIESTFGLSLNTDKFSKDELLNAFRQKVHFYKQSSSSELFEYAHITFYEMDQMVDETLDQMSKIDTGLSLGGLFSSITSSFIGDSYRTGFGTKYINQTTDLIKFSKLYNSLTLASGRQNPYEFGKTIVTAFSSKGFNKLNKIYESSYWVTFVEPKFDLSFVTDTADKEDLLVLHYSDQYTPSKSYDSITVTQKTDQFKMIIEEFLNKHLASVDPDSTKRIVNLFNSLNGEWLLRMIGSNSQLPREKMSILSAVKFSLSFFAHPDIVWIPLSLEEILRVSGSVGLSQKDSLFSSKNLGITGSQSDDLLLVGIETSQDQVKVHYYPIEVKIGKNKSNVIEKAKNQVKATSDIIIDKLTAENFTSTVYKDFLINLAIVNAKKMKLYNIWPEHNWDAVLNERVLGDLLNNNYFIEDSLIPFIGSGGIISFGEKNYFRSVELSNEGILNLSLPEKDGYEFLVIEQNDLFSRIQNSNGDLSKGKLLWNLYKQELEGAQQPISDEDDEDTDTATVNPVPTVPQDGDKHSIDQVIADEPMKIQFGQSLENGQKLFWYPTTTSKIMHTNTGIIGTMGTGKTQFTKSFIKQLHDESVHNVNGTPIGFLIFDYKGDYIKDDFVRATNAKVYDPYHLPFNPLALYQGKTFKPLLPLHTASTIKETISTAFGLGVKQKQFLNDLILEAYESKGIQKANKNTWDMTPPTLHDVYRKFTENEDAKEDSLYAALKQIVDFELFSPYSEETMPLFDLIEGIAVINLAGYDPSVQNLLVGITLDSFYSQMLTKGHSAINEDFRELTKMILVDEADNFLSKDFASLKKIMKEGREFGVGTILSTQFMSHFATADNDYSQYILTWVVHNVSELKKKEVQSIFNTESQQENEQLTNRIRALKKHQSLVTAVSNNKYDVMEDKAFWQLLAERK
ncbi:DNA phosphorothioation-dependent restriction protein DptH [Neobacillus drentensis]|uniref:DNA phosphorothioation-dependent restriction protein DptH n=1 Tax=Neobacillus drentensis TaxID=220684 RepID=UPI001F416D2E|nr:DNA phosphorothioation-dependent restriction protein DptH [Neobacillus drentensis]ULT59608.1 DNA phosphorothioation-dependent restriction protein DptH [Neobacillus drentensis]